MRISKDWTRAFALLTLCLFSSGIVVCGIDHYDTEYISSNDCALVLKRKHSVASSFSDLFLDGNVHEGSETSRTSDCIRYEDVNEALWQAIKDLGYNPRHLNPMDNNELDRIADVFLQTSKNLADKFSLSYNEMIYGLPVIDTSKTDIWDMCPDMYKPSSCSASRFRTIDGRCSSLRNSVMGMARTAFKRFLPPSYSDGLSEPRVSSVDGNPLPHVRKISIRVHRDITQLTASRSTMLMSWGQFIGHDLTMGEFPRDPSGAEILCCPPDNVIPEPNCRPIPIAENDPYYYRYNSTCMQFARNLAGLRPGCALGPRIPTNFVPSRFDANFIYGNTLKQARNLRAFKKGLLVMWPKHQDLGLKDLLPPMTNRPNENCLARPRNKFCFLTGDSRANFQPQVAVLHHVFAREHNRISTDLSYLNPHWDDERLYQETRHIIIAMIQHIAFNELMPELVGPAYVEAYNLTLQKEGYWYGHDKNVPLGTDIAIQTAAFRWGHTLLHTKFSLFDKYHKFLDFWELNFIVIQTFNMYPPGIIDKTILGLVNSPVEGFDRYMTSEMTQHLFQPPDRAFGRDLASLNINRGRDNGLQGYNDYREWCGMSRAKTFEDLQYDLGNSTALLFSKIYKHPDEIDLWSAGIAEYPVEGGFIGPVFACIISRQFSRNRRADRFWYENPGFPSSFTPGQLNEIRKVLQSKITCQNADDIPTIQKWTMLMPDSKRNPRYQCKDLPHINLEYWIEDAESGEFKYYK